MNHALYAAHARAQAAFLKFSTVVGVGVGPKVDRGRVTAREAIVVLVSKKLPARDVPAGELIPKHFGGFPTDVREPILQIPPKPDTAEPPGDWCRTDAQWIDWTKIHQLARAQHPTPGPRGPARGGARSSRPGKPKPKKRRSRGASND